MKKIIKPLKNLGLYLFNSILPKHCISCRQLLVANATNQLCINCFSKLDQLTETDKAEIERIATDIGAENIYTSYRYQGILRKLILGFKFQDAIEYRKQLTQLLPKLKPTEHQNLTEPQLVVPVPMHPLKRIERKYNQAEELALLFAKQTNIVYKPFALKRETYQKQTDKNKQQRATNLSKSISCTEQLNGAHVYLVDDILTTGATLKACIKALKKSGAKKVTCITLCFTPLQDK